MPTNYRALEGQRQIIPEFQAERPVWAKIERIVERYTMEVTSARVKVVVASWFMRPLADAQPSGGAR